MLNFKNIFLCENIDDNYICCDWIKKKRIKKNLKLIFKSFNILIMHI
jgi:hypothetical protein